MEVAHAGSAAASPAPNLLCRPLCPALGAEILGVDLWGNRSTLHARTDFNPNERRLMRRVTILGKKPV